MFRKEYSHREHKCAGCIQYLMMAASPLYLNAHLDAPRRGKDDDNSKKPGSPLVEGLLDDLLEARFGIVVQKEKHLTDAEVDDWFGERADSELAVQYTNGKSLLMKVGKPAIYVSENIISAQRDVRLHFPEFKISNQATLEAVRHYAMTHLAVPLVRELAALHLNERHERIESEMKKRKKLE
ncbi:hypothetical protein M3Y97_01044000 [Aphelenchoides bicaudatus]|nr:hypothetical protein M3Y97_01044000 [Aphelenchoides bicaudatus]